MLYNLYKAIDRTQFQFDFVYFTSKPMCDYDEELLKMGGRIYRIVSSNPVVRMRELIKLLRSHPEWQIVHCHTLFNNAFSVYAAYKAGVPVRIAHSHNTDDRNDKALRGLYRFVARYIINKYSTHFVACGQQAGKFLFPQKKNFSVLPNAIDVAAYVDTVANNLNYIREQYNIDADTHVILQVGRLSNSKNHKFSIEIAKVLHAKGVKFKMFFVGRGPLRDILAEKVIKEGLADCIIFTGLRTDIPQLLAGADVLLMPSLFEGLPVALVEAQTAGLPCVISSNISEEVDLGLNLVTFLGLENAPEYWADILMKVEKPDVKASGESRLKLIRSKGYDVSNIAEMATKLYS